MTAIVHDHAWFLRKWRDDPVIFAEHVFGVQLWSRQKDLLRAVAHHDRTACKSGHKCGKTFSFGILAWWWPTVVLNGDVIMVAPTWNQLKNQLWKEVTTLHRLAVKRGFDFNNPRVYANPNEGVKWPENQGSIFGFSADTKFPERRAGYSGRLLYLLDEASGINDGIHEIASTSPDGRVAMISNPTRGEGAFYNAFHGQKSVWKLLHMSSEEAARENRWLERSKRWALSTANASWIEAMLAKYGKSYTYDIRVRGEFSSSSSDTVMDAGTVQAAIDRWTPDGYMMHLNEPLYVGVDVARYGTDDTVIVWRRGPWASEPIFHHGQNNVEVADRVREIVHTYRRVGDSVIVNVDATNNPGVCDLLDSDSSLGATVVGLNSASSAEDEFDADTGLRCARKREVLWVRGRTWLRAGGAIPPDQRLRAELVSVRYGYNENGAYKIESKRELRKRLGRSSDAADALLLSTYESSLDTGW